MNKNETFETIRKLIEAFPDVEIVDAFRNDSTTYVDFRTSSKNTLARIAYACESSNVLIAVGAPDFQYGYGEPIDSNGLYYRICVPDSDESNPPTIMQALGIFMARDLKALKLISDKFSNDIQEKWNAMKM